MNTKFDELLEFPCPFTFKIMGVASPTLETDVLAVIQNLAPGEYSPTSRMSAKGNYKSLSLSVLVTSKEQIEQIYSQVGALVDVKHIL